MTDKRRFTSDGDRTALAERVVEFDISPRHEWVLIRQILKAEEKTQGGVVLPGEDFFMNAGKGKTQRGEVVAVGPKSDLEVGDMVVFTFFAMEIEGLKDLTGRDDLRLVRDEEVYAVARLK